jgi:hypothetical protein
MDTEALLEKFQAQCDVLKHSLMNVAGSDQPDFTSDGKQSSRTENFAAAGSESNAHSQFGLDWAHALHELAALHQRLADGFELALERFRNAVGKAELLQLEKDALSYHLQLFEAKRGERWTQTGRARAARILDISEDTTEDAVFLKERLKEELAARQRLAAQLEEVQKQILVVQSQEETHRQLLTECLPAYEVLRRHLRDIDEKVATRSADERE